MTDPSAPSIFDRLLKFRNELEAADIYYRMNSVRGDAVMFEVTVPGQRWEVEFMSDGTIEVERFLSNGDILDEASLGELFREFGGA